MGSLFHWDQINQTDQNIPGQSPHFQFRMNSISELSSYFHSVGIIFIQTNQKDQTNQTDQKDLFREMSYSFAISLGPDRRDRRKCQN